MSALCHSCVTRLRHEADFPFVRGGKHDHAAFQTIEQHVGNLSQIVDIVGFNDARSKGKLFYLLLLRKQRIDISHGAFFRERSDFLLELLVLRQFALNMGNKFIIAAFERVRGCGESLRLLIHVVDSRLACQSLDAAHARSDACLADNLKHANLADVFHMRAAAELYAEIRHRDDAHDIAVLLAEERHSAEFLRLVDFHLRDFHRLCHENLLIDQALHFLQLQRRHRLEI